MKSSHFICNALSSPCYWCTCFLLFQPVSSGLRRGWFALSCSMRRYQSQTRTRPYQAPKCPLLELSSSAQSPHLIFVLQLRNGSFKPLVLPILMQRGSCGLVFMPIMDGSRSIGRMIVRRLNKGIIVSDSHLWSPSSHRGPRRS